MNPISTYQSKETIAAIATPPGDGGVAIIRISGNDAIDIAEKIYSGPVRKYRSHQAHYGSILDKNGDPVDQVLLLVMLAPRSYTGENTVEIHCHGGHLITRKVLEIVLEAGARPAQPGEFTFRAFMNGKLDLSQAEAVQSLIGSKNGLALQAAKHQLEGRLSQKISDFQKKLLDIAAILEAWVDFPEEDLAFAPMEEITASLKTLKKEIETLQNTFQQGQKIHQGITLCLAGRPNVGKSSLMNALLGKNRAIVTDIPGTTRDLLEEDLHLGQLHFRLMDTAGIRNTEEQIEKEGIRRSFEALQRADLILFVLDATQPLCASTQSILAAAPPEKTILIWNKIDLLPSDPLPPKLSSFPHLVALSAKFLTGLDQLHEKIHQVIWQESPPQKEELIITQIRHERALDTAAKALNTLIEGLQSGISPEFAASDMRHALNALGTIIGMDTSEEILTAIFSQFCVGK